MLPNISQLNLSIQVSNPRLNPKPGSAVKAFVTVQYGPVKFDVSITSSHNGGYFVGFPSKPSNQNKDKWFEIVQVSEPERSEIVQLALQIAKDANLI